jgi:hypothetical protein
VYRRIRLDQVFSAMIKWDATGIGHTLKLETLITPSRPLVSTTPSSKLIGRLPNGRICIPTHGSSIPKGNGWPSNNRPFPLIRAWLRACLETPACM